MQRFRLRGATPIVLNYAFVLYAGKLMTFERRIMRKIFGPTRTDDGYWRIKTNQEINEILKG